MTFPEAFAVIDEFAMPTMPADYERQLALSVARRIEESSGDETFAEIIDQAVSDLVGETQLYGY